MAHHKRRRPKNRRAGCKLCKPWKINHAKGDTRSAAQKRAEAASAAGDERSRTALAVGSRASTFGVRAWWQKHQREGYRAAQQWLDWWRNRT